MKLIKPELFILVNINLCNLHFINVFGDWRLDKQFSRHFFLDFGTMYISQDLVNLL